MDGLLLKWFQQAAPTEWSLIREAFGIVSDIASGLTVFGFFVVLTWAWFTKRIVLGSDMEDERKEKEEWKQEARRGEQTARRGAETIQATAEAVEKDK